MIGTQDATLLRVSRRADKSRDAMQLRVARLCLDCEELYVGSVCPVCASDRYAFLSTWLPSEERRRWRRPAPRTAHAGQRHFAAVKRLLARWFGHDDLEETTGSLKTRASDFVPQLDFDEPHEEPHKQPTHASAVIKNDG